MPRRTAARMRHLRAAATHARDPLEEARARIAELEDNWRRTAAELDNFRKRCAKDLVRARQQERARTAAGWLPVLDNLELALEHASSDPEHIIEGVSAGTPAGPVGAGKPRLSAA